MRGLAVGWLAVRGPAARAARLDGLYPVASLATAALAFGAADALHGSGFLAVYLAGLVLGSARIPAKRTVTAFHEGLAWVAQITLFFALGLLVFPSELGDVALEGTVLALVLVLVARPVAAFVSTAFERFTTRTDRARLGRPARRGAGGARDLPGDRARGRHEEFFNIVFFAVLISTLLQGTTFEPLAKRLGVTTTSRRCRARWPRPARSGGSAPRSSSTRSGPMTRSSARACASSGCRATRSCR